MSGSYYENREKSFNLGKFIGGAERARRNAMNPKRQLSPSGHDFPHKKFRSNLGNFQKDPERLPHSMHPWHRFFASMMMSSLNDIEQDHEGMMQVICERLQLPLPEPSPSSFSSHNQYYRSRASLVMEESRAIMSDALKKLQRKPPHLSTWKLQLTSIEKDSKTGAVTIVFEKPCKQVQQRNNKGCKVKGPQRHPKDKLTKKPLSSDNIPPSFTPTELAEMKVGCCFSLEPIFGASRASWPVLACVQCSKYGDGTAMYGNSSTLRLTIYNRDAIAWVMRSERESKHEHENDNNKSKIWLARPLMTTLIGQLRQFEVCVKAPLVPFMDSVLGRASKGTHTRYSYSSDESKIYDTKKQSGYDTDNESDTSSNQSNTSNYESDTSNYESDTSSNKSDTFNNQSNTSSNQSDTSSNQSDTSNNQSNTSSNQSDTSNNQSDTSNNQSKNTSSNQSDTSSNQSDTSSNTSSNQSNTSNNQSNTSNNQSNISSNESDTSSNKSDTTDSEILLNNRRDGEVVHETNSRTERIKNSESISNIFCSSQNNRVTNKINILNSSNCEVLQDSECNSSKSHKSETLVSSSNESVISISSDSVNETTSEIDSSPRSEDQDSPIHIEKEDEVIIVDKMKDNSENVGDDGSKFDNHESSDTESESDNHESSDNESESESRSDNESESESRSDNESESESRSDNDTHSKSEKSSMPGSYSVIYGLPFLNKMQTRAIQRFVTSPHGTLQLVQGPPGTGKTTFLVSLIFHNLFYQRRHGSDRRILVCAPTNRAIAVIAQRFINHWKADPSSINIVLIGVEDKLIDTAGSTEKMERIQGSSDDNSASLREIFVYSWLECLSDRLKQFLRTIEDSRNLKFACTTSRNLIYKIKRCIPKCANEAGVTDSCNVIMHILEQLRQIDGSNSSIDINSIKSDDADSREALWSDLKKAGANLLKFVGRINNTMCVEELLSTASVIFCTLSSAGTAAFKRTRQVDDLFIDEAAAATEPEICIPFLLRPKRMLAVGDPLQLPATVMSAKAIEYGLDKSLHHRLMYDCQDHVKTIMLNIQYRMRPEISTFPSTHFYKAQLLDGPNVVEGRYQGDTLLLNHDPYIFLHVEGTEQCNASGSYYNEREGGLVIRLIREFKSKHTKLISEAPSRCHSPWHCPSKIRVITFYSGQVSLIQQLLKRAQLETNVTVATVDSSQGCEADVVIISFVRSRSNKSNIGFLSDDRRINVALTRAKYQLICIGNIYDTLSKSRQGDVCIKPLVENAKDRGCVRVVA